jgi:hypothetical protein
MGELAGVFLMNWEKSVIFEIEILMNIKNYYNNLKI